MNAKIDAAGSGQYAEVDEEGRYKVVMPFDLSGNGEGKASRYIRMAQPYSGANYGMHFPLHKGTEVIWTCIDGDLDRPIICGSVPNPATASPVTGGNQTQSVIRTGGNNLFEIEDTAGSERQVLTTPFANTQFAMGALYSAAPGIYWNTDESWTANVGQNQTTTIKQGNRKTTVEQGNDTLEVQTGTQSVTVKGDTSLTVQTGNRSVKVGANHSTQIAANMNLNVGANKTEQVAIASTETIGGAKALTVGAGYAISVAGAMNKAVGMAAFEEVGLTKKIIVGDQLEIVCGSSRIVLESGGKVTIEGTEFLFSASGEVKINGSVIDLN